MHDTVSDILMNRTQCFISGSIVRDILFICVSFLGLLVFIYRSETSWLRKSMSYLSTKHFGLCLLKTVSDIT